MALDPFTEGESGPGSAQFESDSFTVGEPASWLGRVGA